MFEKSPTSFLIYGRNLEKPLSQPPLTVTQKQVLCFHVRLRFTSEKLIRGCSRRNSHFVSVGDRKGIQIWELEIITKPNVWCIRAKESANGATAVWVRYDSWKLSLSPASPVRLMILWSSQQPFKKCFFCLMSHSQLLVHASKKPKWLSQYLNLQKLYYFQHRICVG